MIFYIFLIITGLIKKHILKNLFTVVIFVIICDFHKILKTLKLHWPLWYNEIYISYKKGFEK